MTQGAYPYPDDEFDGVDRSAGPRGSHRRPRSAWARLWPYVLVLAVSAVLAVALVGWVWQDRAPAPALQGPGAAAGSGTEDAPAPDDVTASPSPPGEPDLTVPVSVVNATSVRGLAAEVAQRLRDAGWSEVTTGNYAGADLATSTVRYAAPELEASARAVADELGITAVELAPDDDQADPASDDSGADDDAGQGIEVVLDTDFDA